MTDVAHRSPTLSHRGVNGSVYPFVCLFPLPARATPATISRVRVLRSLFDIVKNPSNELSVAARTPPDFGLLI
jgi:hypothetical protein